MKFVDSATITVESGHGGAGCVSFRREKYVPRGGPDGGDGGRGGDVVLVASSDRRTLYHFWFKRHHKAGRGAHGQGKQKTGKSGEDVVLQVPVGTLVKDPETGATLVDLDADSQRWTAAKGGRGGRGNQHFATSTRQAPRHAQPGEPGEARTLVLELKLLADAGLVGLPNAGKSSLIRVLSAARPRVADYPFTTLAPVLGVVSVPGAEPFVVADIPGLIEGAHAGAGLGDRFLRHVERTRVLVHVLEANRPLEVDPVADFHTVRSELAAYGEGLADKPFFVVMNKMDLSGAEDLARRFEDETGHPVLRVSAVTHQGLDALKARLQQAVAPDESTVDRAQEDAPWTAKT